MQVVVEQTPETSSILLARFIFSFAKLKRISSEVTYRSDSSISILLEGKGVLALFSNHSGKHTVTRVPPTEKGGRRHTSVLSVAVLPVPKEVDYKLDPKDLEITTMRSNCKAGGAGANTCDSAVRMVHKPSGLSVKVDQERKQLQNRAIALRIITSKVQALEDSKRLGDLGSLKSNQLGNMGRSDKAFTWNLYEGFITNHASGNQTRKVKEVLKGNLDLIS